MLAALGSEEKESAMKAIPDGRRWIDAYVEKKDARLGEVAQGLRRLMKEIVAGAKETVNPWRIPTFESNGPMCFFMIGKNHVTFGFLRGTSLHDPARLLEGTGRNLRHVKLHSMDDLRKPALKKLIQAAARLNKRKPMEGMSRGRSRIRNHSAQVFRQRFTRTHLVNQSRGEFGSLRG
jgi:hypothetical protein